MEAIFFIRFLNKLKDFLKKFDLDGVTNSVAVDKVWFGSDWTATLSIYFHYKYLSSIFDSSQDFLIFDFLRTQIS